MLLRPFHRLKLVVLCIFVLLLELSLFLLGFFLPEVGIIVSTSTGLLARIGALSWISHFSLLIIEGKGLGSTSALAWVKSPP
jgi:hypothetical protein